MQINIVDIDIKELNLKDRYIGNEGLGLLKNIKLNELEKLNLNWNIRKCKF